MTFKQLVFEIYFQRVVRFPSYFEDPDGPGQEQKPQKACQHAHKEGEDVSEEELDGTVYQDLE
jgi:hypothetical protein